MTPWKPRARLARGRARRFRQVFFGRRRLDEFRRVVVGCVSRQLHSRDHHAHIWISCFHFIDHLLEIVLDLVDRHPAKGIVDSQLENKDVDLAFQVRREPFQASLGRAASLAGVGQFKIQAGGAQSVCQ